MTPRTRIIFWLLLLVVGFQWIGDPVDCRLTTDPTPVAGWHNPDQNGPDTSHHFGVAMLEAGLFPQAHVAILPPDLRLSGPVLLGWVLPAAESPHPPSLAASCQSLRAPPAA